MLDKNRAKDITLTFVGTFPRSKKIKLAMHNKVWVTKSIFIALKRL
jgi:hypothetical protein